MDKMDLFEAKALMDYYYLAHLEEWEQARLVAYLIALCNSRKELKLTDIVKFQWEKEAKSGSNTAISNADLDRLKQMAKQYTEQIKN